MAVREVLVQYRDFSPNHLLAHTHLLHFLSQEFRQETELLCHHYRVTATQFSFDQSVVTFCQLLTKSIEDEDLEDSFEDEHEGLGEHSKPNSKVSVYKVTFCIPIYSFWFLVISTFYLQEILVRTIKYLDYEINRDDMQCWSLLAECFNHLQGCLHIYQHWTGRFHLSLSCSIVDISVPPPRAASRPSATMSGRF